MAIKKSREYEPSAHLSRNFHAIKKCPAEAGQGERNEEIIPIDNYKCLNSCSCVLYTIFCTCLTDMPNSSLRGSKHMPSNRYRFKISRFRCECLFSITHSSMALSISEREYSSSFICVLLLFFCLLTCRSF